MIRVDDSTVFNPETGEFGYLPDIIQFEADRTLLIDSTPATVTWTVSNATKVLLNNQSVQPTGTQQFHSNDIMEVVLIAENSLGQTTPRKIIIDIDREPPNIRSFVLDKKLGIKGTPVKISWIIEGAHSIMIDNGVGNVTGLSEKIITLGYNGVFNISAKNYFGFGSTSVVAITVFPTTIIENLFIPKPDLDIRAVSSNQPTFNLSLDINATRIAPNINFVDLSSTGGKLFTENMKIKSNAYGVDTFVYLTKKQQEITHIVRSVWKREAKEILKRLLRQNQEG